MLDAAFYLLLLSLSMILFAASPMMLSPLLITLDMAAIDIFFDDFIYSPFSDISSFFFFCADGAAADFCMMLSSDFRCQLSDATCRCLMPKPPQPALMPRLCRRRFHYAAAELSPPFLRFFFFAASCHDDVY